MPDMTTVIEGLECCTARNGTCQYKQEPVCPYVEHCQKEDYAALQRDALALLKEQQEPKTGHWIESAGDDKCSVCGATYSDLYPDYHRTHYCPSCGAKMQVIS